MAWRGKQEQQQTFFSHRSRTGTGWENLFPMWIRLHSIPTHSHPSAFEYFSPTNKQLFLCYVSHSSPANLHSRHTLDSTTVRRGESYLRTKCSQVQDDSRSCRYVASTRVSQEDRPKPQPPNPRHRVQGRKLPILQQLPARDDNTLHPSSDKPPTLETLPAPYPLH